MYGGSEVGGRSGRPKEDGGKPEADGHRTGTGRNKWRNRGSIGNSERSGGKGEVRRREDSRTKFVRRKGHRYKDGGRAWDGRGRNW